MAVKKEKQRKRRDWGVQVSFRDTHSVTKLPPTEHQVLKVLPPQESVIGMGPSLQNIGVLKTFNMQRILYEKNVRLQALESVNPVLNIFPKQLPHKCTMRYACERKLPL
jgi:hypothetical protein